MIRFYGEVMAQALAIRKWQAQMAPFKNDYLASLASAYHRQGLCSELMANLKVVDY